MIKAILRENGLPEDLSYIALIESGLNPKARSRANAVGMWQFIRGTGKRYGLRVDWWIDERMDPEKATVAAAKYLKNLYDQFGSWYLAAAGYNAGEGKISRAVKRHGTDDFWTLASHKRPLKRETKEYVPKYLAAMLIAKDPLVYGFDEQDHTRVIAYDKVSIPNATDVRVIAEAAGTTVEEIKALNPELLRWFTPPNYPGYEIKIPAGTKDLFLKRFSDVPPSQRIAFLTHKVKKGETLSKIAKRYGTSVDPIVYLNNLKSTKRIRAGTVLMVPVRADKGYDRKRGEVAEVIISKGLSAKL
jgi:membrane-bound lytic murein transglycosylase D